MLDKQILLTEAAREGARYAAVTGADPDAVRAKVSAILGENPTSLTVTPCPVNATGAQDATVQLTFTYAAKTPLGSMMLIFGPDAAVDVFDLTAQGVMPCVG